MSYKDEECKGCLAHNTYHCNILPNYGPLKCPCLVCLIKGMCRNDCEAIRKYTKETLSYGCMYKK